jgi:hypothetical protein
VKVLSPDKTVMGRADGVYGPAGNSPLYVRGECKGPPRGLRPCRASHGDYAVTREIRQSARKEAHPWTSVRSEEEGGGCRKSEAPIRARRSGNPGGAKGGRFEGTGKGDMGRHRADEDHDHATYSFYPEVPLWGGFKLGAGWCNAPRPVLRGAGRVTVGSLRSCGTAGKPGGNREDKHQPVPLGEPGLLTKSWPVSFIK